MPIPCAFCPAPAERVCAWPVRRDWLGKVLARCGKPVCFRHMREPGEEAHCADHWHEVVGERLPHVSEWEARDADADPDRFNFRRRGRASFRGAR